MQASAPSKPSKRKAAKGRGLNALQIAETENPEQVKIRRHRLGESYDDDGEPEPRADANDRSSKRQKVTHDEDGEGSEGGSDLDGERWHVGVEEDDDDSDLDSDEAFGESDEERFADFTFRGSKSNASRNPVGNKHSAKSDEEMSEDDDFGDEGVDLATALDMNENDENEDSKPKKNRRRTPSPEEVSDGSEDDGVSVHTDDSEEDLDPESEFSVSDQGDGDHDRLQNFVQSLTTKKSGQDQSSMKEKMASSKISAADLLQYVKDPQQRQSLKILQNNEVKAPEAYRGGVPGRLAPPLAKRQQDRLDRVAAYDESKKELGKWVETVKQNRRADHLSFPLVDPESAAASNNSHLAPASQSQPISSLESKIQEILQESGAPGKGSRSAEQEEQAFEELEEKKLPLAEVQARRAELRQLRDLMFREEIRAKRIKKIKSKAYRRIHRKERDRANLREQTELTAAGLVDSDEEREKADRQRAEERMGARHRESKWAKAMKATGRAAWDDDARGSVNDLARRDEELRRKVEGKVANGSDGSESESQSDGYDSDIDDQDLGKRLMGVENTTTGGVHSKLHSMAFMKRAEAARKEANDLEIRGIRGQLRGDDYDSQHRESDSDIEPAPGRQHFGGQVAVKQTQPATKAMRKSEFEELQSDEEEQGFDLGKDEVPVPQPGMHTPEPLYSSKGTVRQQDQVSQVAGKSNKAKAPLAQQSSKTSKSQPRKALLTTKQNQTQLLEAPNSPSDSSPSNQDPTTPNPDEPNTLAEALFFGDDEVLPAFTAEKTTAILSEDDQPLDDPNALPGWGSWTGAGISKKAQKRSLANLKKKSNHNSQNAVIKGVKPEDRRDARLDRVIVNEKRVKKNNKYLATELPHPFETRAQYERSLRVPMGPEWTTKATFQDGVKPRVLVKQGVIRAVRKPIA